MTLTISELLAYSTARIECELKNGTQGTGTGFFFQFEIDGKEIPVIITNKHVVRDAVRSEFLLHTQDITGMLDSAGWISVVSGSFEKDWVPHPEEDVDLCFMFIAPAIQSAMDRGVRPFYCYLNFDLIPVDSEFGELVAVEDVLMVGYPNGLWDVVNNMPIFRRGITATHPGKRYNGRAEFLIDAACFPGSSGSPVLLYNPGMYTGRSGSVVGNARVKLLGVLYAGPQYTATGEVKIINIPTLQVPVAQSRLPLNLGVVINSAKLRGFEDSVKKRLGQVETDV